MSCSQGEGREFTVGPLKYRVMEFFDVGHRVEEHEHDFDHATVCIRGEVAAYVDGVETILRPGDWVNVPATARHAMVGRAPNSRADCVFVNRGTERDAL